MFAGETVGTFQESRAEGIGHLENGTERPLGQGVEVSAPFRDLAEDGASL
jgi:hypothetical protein